MLEVRSAESVTDRDFPWLEMGIGHTLDTGVTVESEKAWETEGLHAHPCIIFYTPGFVECFKAWML